MDLSCSQNCSRNRALQKSMKGLCDYPYKVNDKEMEKVQTPSYFFLCRNDKLIKQHKTEMRVKSTMPGYKETFFFSNVGHAIEFSHEAIGVFKELIKKNIV